MGFGSLQHIRDRRSTSRRPSVPASFRPQGLATLSTACSLEPVPALFHAGGAHGILPSEPSPLEQAPPRSRGRLPRVPFLRSLCPPPKRWAGATVRGFRGLTRPSVPCGGRVMSAADRRMLPWDSPFQGVPANAFAEISPRVLPRAWDTADSGERPHRAPRSINQHPPDPN
jgi:hypothetical protein